MACIAVPVKINNDRAYDFWVDTGATFSSIPRDILETAGVIPLETIQTQLADGSKQRVEKGEVKLQVVGLTIPLTCQVTFAPVGAPFLLGAHALDGFGLWVDVEHATLAKQDSVLLCGHNWIVGKKQRNRRV